MTADGVPFAQGCSTSYSPVIGRRRKIFPAGMTFSPSESAMSSTRPASSASSRLESMQSLAAQSR